MSKFDDDDDSVPKKIFILAPGGGWVEKDLCEELRRQVIFIVPYLDPAKDYRIQDTVLPEFWRPLSKGQRRNLGRVLAHWVSAGEFDLEFVGCPRCNRKLYRRRR